MIRRWRRWLVIREFDLDCGVARSLVCACWTRRGARRAARREQRCDQYAPAFRYRWRIARRASS